MAPLFSIPRTIVCAFLTIITPVALSSCTEASESPQQTARYSDPAQSTAARRIKRRSLPISPGLIGFGTKTPAGSGRHLRPPRSRIIRVTSVADYGPGSLRACVEAREPRTCIFEVSGEISVSRPLRIRSPYITIAGQTAPAPGITVSHGGIQVQTHDVFIQHIAVRPGDFREGVPPAERDGISIGSPAPRSAFRVVIDHVSLTWAIDENISTWDPSTRDITITNSIIAEGLHNSIHPKGPHSKGIMIGDGTRNVTLRRNLIASNEERNPYLKPGSATEMINNVVYNWGPRGGWSLCNLSNNDESEVPVALSFIGNSYIPGPRSFFAPPIYAKNLAPGSRIYVRDNRWGYAPMGANSPWAITSIPEAYYRAPNPPLRSSPAAELSADAAYQTVRRTAGSRPRHRDAVDSRIVTEVATRTGGLKDCLAGCARSVGGWPHIPTRRRALRPPQRPFADTNRDGYTNLENWLHRLAKRVQ
jgi:hypothetical protein